MDFVILLVALGLAMDSFSVSVTRGIVNTKTSILVEALKAGVFFGGFQAIMTFVGWLSGVSVSNLISDYDHWIAFGLLVFIGFRMIYESIRKESKKMVSSSSISVLLVLSIATSIDALAVGLSYSFLKVSILTPAIIIGITAFVLSFMGVYVGKRFGGFFERIEILGGLILIGIGIRILLEHVKIN